MKQFLIPIVLAAVLCGGAVLLSRSKPPLPELGSLTPFTFEDADSGSFTRSSIAGKTSIWTFFFTSCEGPCPTTQAAVAKLQRQLGDLKNIEFVSLSIDPARDTAERLREYRAKLGGNAASWRMLRPIPGETAVDQFSVQSFRAGLELEALVHSTRLLLVDSSGTVRGAYDVSTEEGFERIESDARALASE